MDILLASDFSGLGYERLIVWGAAIVGLIVVVAVAVAVLAGAVIKKRKR